jgi:hypothetical protein
VQSQAVRLRQRLAAAPAPQAPFRNPFAFAARPQPEPRGTTGTPAASPVAAFVEQLIAEPALSLIGLATTDTPGAGPARTAIVTDAAGDIFLVAAGDVLVNRYQVVGVAADAVDLRDRLTGTTRRLALK